MVEKDDVAIGLQSVRTNSFTVCEETDNCQQVFGTSGILFPFSFVCELGQLAFSSCAWQRENGSVRMAARKWQRENGSVKMAA